MIVLILTDEMLLVIVKKLARMRGLDSLAALKFIGYIPMGSILLGNIKR